jgi:hypothetical protein
LMSNIMIVIIHASAPRIHSLHGTLANVQKLVGGVPVPLTLLRR